MNALLRARCAHGIAGQSRQGGIVPGGSRMADQHFQLFATLREHIRHAAERTANAVGVYAPPGFKSRSLRS